MMTGSRENNNGIVAGHAYSVISVVEFEYRGEIVCLLKLRNPWGHHEFKGDWSDQSSLWTEELRKFAGCTIEEDGTFFINLADYLRTFR